MIADLMLVRLGCEEEFTDATDVLFDSKIYVFQNSTSSHQTGPTDTTVQLMLDRAGLLVGTIEQVEI
jgi:hypothetical protein